MRSSKFLLLFLTITLALGSCISRKQTVYLQPDTESLDFSRYNSPRIQRDDQLTILVSAADPQVVAIFNPQLQAQRGTQAGGLMTQDMAMRPSYLVDEFGEIDFPVLGKVKLGGLTRREASDFMKKKLSTYVVDVGVNIAFSNFRVSVLGEVRSPGVFTLPQERITVLEALAMAGDMTRYGVRSNVLLVRERDGVKETHRLDLTSDSLLNSPHYYLTQNDVLYVEPNNSQVRDSNFGQNTNVFISVTSILITITTLIISLRR